MDIILWRKHPFLSKLSISVKAVKIGKIIWGQDALPPLVTTKTLNMWGILCFPIDKWMTVRMLVDMPNIGKPSVDTILNENLGLKNLCVKIILKLLTPDQKLRRKEPHWLENLTKTPNFLLKSYL